jgi:sulfatase modifying factor 1
MSFVHAPNVECALGKHVMVQNAMRIGFESAVAERVKELGANGFTSADEMSEWTAKMHLLSGGKNSIKWVSDGASSELYWPCIVVRRPAQKAEFYLTGAGDDIHPAFKAGSTNYDQYWMSKYPGPYIASNSKIILLSLPGFDGMSNLLTRAEIRPNYDSALTYGKAGGNGSHCVTNAEWMEVAMSCLREGFQPKGNNYFGRDYNDPDTAEYYGIPASWSSSTMTRVLNGSGPLSWFHDGSPWGIWGMNGNFYQVTAGLRQKAGEIQVIANNDAALDATDQSDASAAWKAILQDGSLVAPGTDLTLKYDATTPITIGTEISTRTSTVSKSHEFGNVVAADGITIPNIAKLLGIAPAGSAAELGGDYIDLRNDIDGLYLETLARRSGNWAYNTRTGVFILRLGLIRGAQSNDYGARSAFL